MRVAITGRRVGTCEVSNGWGHRSRSDHAVAMETVIIQTRHGGVSRSPIEPFKNKDFKPVLIYSASQVWPRRDSPAPNVYEG